MNAPKNAAAPRRSTSTGDRAADHYFHPNSTPYGQASLFYGWGNLLPLPAGAKFPPPAGYTGEHGKPVTAAERTQWANHTGNYALRLPDGVMAIDVDNYGDKAGAATLAAKEGELGALPATYACTRRDPSTGSSHRYYRYPGGKLASVVGEAVEVLQHGHRYAVVWPSVVDGALYRWYAPDGTELAGPPSLEALPELPEAWVNFLRAGAAASVGPAAPTEVASGLLAELLADTGQPCAALVSAAQEGAQRIVDAGGGGRHDAATGAVFRLVSEAARGHDGYTLAMQHLAASWDEAIGHDPSRAGEFDRMVSTAVAKVANDVPRRIRLDPTMHWCDRPADNAALSSLDAATEGAGDAVDGWAPLDLTEYANGTHQPPQATLMCRTDGAGLLYPGKTHAFNGEPESGKSMLAQWAVAEELRAGRHVLVLDYESDAASYVERVRAMGVAPEVITERLAYVNPPGDPATSPHARARLVGLVKSRTFSLAVVDGLTEALALMGGSSNSGDDVTRWQKAVPRLLADHGPAVVVVDHVTKDTESRGRFAIGSQSKLAALTGAAYLVDVAKPLGRGNVGELVLKVAKDRPGYVRGKAGRWSSRTRLQEAARVLVDGTFPERIIVTVTPPSVDTDGDGQFRPTGYMERVSRVLEGVEKPPTFNKIAEAVEGKRAAVQAAVAALVAEGFVEKEQKGSAHFHRSLKPYRENDDPKRSRFLAGTGNQSNEQKTPNPSDTGSLLRQGNREPVRDRFREPVGNHSEPVQKNAGSVREKLTPEQQVLYDRAFAKDGERA